ncbi:acetyltransferase (GNAT) family protein [Micromonospora pisi]|uniref:Acetyltransferase (GNAT) family protein n=1 Tax=Micromonospora pisi TaxID=589240 RepID=A0A495JGJ4_9ACTN|nr:GNAT family N-acetyltransferase [Micromonospora pisi]RKR87504.1 acetyltransferase (GNAT) family protein [Micromonospora pisi]
MNSSYVGASDPTSADAAAAAWFVAMRAKIDAVAGAHAQQGAGGVHRFVSGVRIPSGNGVFIEGTDPDLRQVAAFADEMRGGELPWSIQVRGEPGPELARLAAGYGLTARAHSPLMTRGAGPVPHAVPASGARVRPTTGADADVYGNLIATALGLPRPAIGEFASAPLLDAPGMTGYLVEWDGVPAGTGLGTHLGDQFGVYNITVAPTFRRRGFARLVSETVLRDGFAAGARAAFLHTTPHAQPLYESLGFRTVETWTYLVPEPRG